MVVHPSISLGAMHSKFLWQFRYSINLRIESVKLSSPLAQLSGGSAGRAVYDRLQENLEA
jgi:hypothetical protein